MLTMGPAWPSGPEQWSHLPSSDRKTLCPGLPGRQTFPATAEEQGRPQWWAHVPRRGRMAGYDSRRPGTVSANPGKNQGGWPLKEMQVLTDVRLSPDSA